MTESPEGSSLETYLSLHPVLGTTLVVVLALCVTLILLLMREMPSLVYEAF